MLGGQRTQPAIPSLLTCKQVEVISVTNMTAEEHCMWWPEAGKPPAHSHGLMLTGPSSMLIDTTAANSMLLDSTQHNIGCNAR